MSSESAIERMKAYKGPGFPAAIIPLSGLVLGVALPTVLATYIYNDYDDNLSPTEVIILCFETLSWASALFFSEFILGAAARSTSTKASFSPAAATAAGAAPFAIVQCNRIHQNHIENFLIVMPMVFAAAAAGTCATAVVSLVASWTLCRVVYRIGYTQTNPFWRLCGQTASITLFLQAAGLFVQQKMQV